MGAVQPHFGNRPVFGKELEKLVQIVFVVVIHIESELGLVRERSAGHLTRNSPQRRLAPVAVQSVRTLYLVQVGRRKIYSELETVFPAGKRQILEHISFSIAEPT